jgi:hypothetical protein
MSKKLHYIFDSGAPQSPAKPLQDLIVLKKNAAHCRRWVKVDQCQLRKVFGRTLDIGWVHIHSDSLDLGGIGAVLDQRLGKGPEGQRFGFSLKAAFHYPPLLQPKRLPAS